jgi:hypothetical protein
MTGAERMARSRARRLQMIEDLSAENERLRRLLRAVSDGTVPPSAVGEEVPALD